MHALVIFSAVLAVAAAGAPGVLLPKINYAAPEVTVVKQPYPVIQKEFIHRDVPVPVHVTRHVVEQPAPIVQTPVINQYVAPAVTTYAAAPAYAHSYAAVPAAYGAYGTYGAYGAYGAYGQFPAVKYL